MDEDRIIRSITGRAPTEEQAARIAAIASSLSIRENDAFLGIIVALDAYYGAISDVPRRIDEAGKMAVDSAAAMASSAATHAAATAREHIEKAVNISGFARQWRSSVITTLAVMSCTIFAFGAAVFLLMSHFSDETRAALDRSIAVLPKQIETASVPILRDAAKLAADDVIARMDGTLSQTVTDRVDNALGFIKPQLPFIHVLVALEAQSPGILNTLASKEGVQIARLLKANAMNACPLLKKTSDGITTCTFVSP